MEANRNRCEQQKVNVSRVPVCLDLVSKTDSQQTIDLHQFCLQEYDAELQEDNLMYQLLLAKTKNPTGSPILHSPNVAVHSLPLYMARAIPPEASWRKVPTSDPHPLSRTAFVSF